MLFRLSMDENLRKPDLQSEDSSLSSPKDMIKCKRNEDFQFLLPATDSQRTRRTHSISSINQKFPSQLRLGEVAFFRTIDSRKLSISTTYSCEQETLDENSSTKDNQSVQKRESVFSPVQRKNKRIGKKTRLLKKLNCFEYFQFDSSLSDFDRQRIQSIYEFYPDEFDLLIPKLIQFGVIKWPKTLFENQIDFQTLNSSEIELRRYFMKIFQQEDSSLKKKFQLRILFERNLFDHHHYQHYRAIRESLSFAGQISLLKVYEDQFRRELNVLIGRWNSSNLSNHCSSLSSASSRSSKSSRSSSSSFTSSSSLSSNRSNSSKSDRTSLDTFLSTIPQQIDPKWNEKLIVSFIEQIIFLSDQLRGFSSILSRTNSDDLYRQTFFADPDEIEDAFQRWTALVKLLFE